MSDPQSKEAPAKHVLVINDTERILHFCETSTVQNLVDGKQVDIPFHKSHALIPGCNVVVDDKWFKQFQESHVAKFHRREGKLKVLPLAADKSGKQSEGLLGFDADDAISYIQKTFQLRVLEDWQAVETRGDVKDALKKQHAYVKSELEAPEQEDRIMFKSGGASNESAHMRI